jgi:hypothetical protein
MTDIIKRLENEMQLNSLRFTKKPILIGGLAMEYYGMRKAGADIDFVICDADYQELAQANPDKRKDIWGDMGVVIGPFEIWRSIALLDYDFYKEGAIDRGAVLVVSIERLMLMRVIAMDVKKYMDDLKRIRDYYYTNFTNEDFRSEQAAHMSSYKSGGGVIFAGKYKDE